KKEEGEASAEEGGKTPSAGEFLSGFWVEDRLIPSITVTIFFGSEEWDGPLSLFEMMDVSDPDVLACMDNYHVRLIAPAQMTDEEIMKFQSSLREVLLFIKYSKDRENLSRVLVANEKRFRELERRAADVIEVITNSGIKYDESEEVIDVCQAIQEIRMEERKIGEQDGRLNKAKEDARNFYNLGVDIEKIAQGVGYAVETIKEWLGLGS
ncbi:MAG: transposase, partial [Lachnospiraceae bacterium]|nr:transposase [Lachnospiraceae bacterium]